MLNFPIFWGILRYRGPPPPFPNFPKHMYESYAITLNQVCRRPFRTSIIEFVYTYQLIRNHVVLDVVNSGGNVNKEGMRPILYDSVPYVEEGRKEKVWTT
jgi:hypothetical protein